MQSDRLHNDRYLSWIKTSLSLLYLKEGTSDFSNETAKDFHREVLERVALRSTAAATSTCGTCSYKSAVKTKHKDKKKTTWRMNCKSNICSVWLEEMLPYHKHLPCPNIAWENSDPCLWPTDSWEIAKVFQPFGCKNHKSAEDSDASALLTLILDCSFFNKFISNPATIQDIKNARNACMHSNDMEMSDVDMKESLDLMISFLAEPCLKRFQSSCDAIEKIKQLRDNLLDLSLNKELELKALKHKMKEIEDDVTRVADDAKKLHDDINRVTETQESSLDDCSRLNDRLGKLDDSLNEVTANLQTLARMQDPDIGAKVTDLTNRVQVLEKEAEEGNRKMDDIQKAKMAKLEAEMQDLKSNVQEIQSGIQDKKTSVGDLRNTLMDLYRENFQRIPIYLLRPTMQHQVRNVLVKQELKVVDHRGKPKKSERHTEKPDPEEKSIAALNDMFYKDGTKCKNIFLAGESGVGKSTFCKHLIRIWCDAHTEADRTKLKEDLATMVEFELLFYINLREAKINSDAPKSDEIAKLIHEQLELSEVCTISDMRRYLSDPSTLVLMDSLDELRSKRFPRRGLHNKSCIITTSRPWKLEAFRSQLEGNIDQQIEIVGLQQESAEKLSENIVTLLNKDLRQTKDCNQFIQKIKKESLQQFLKIPILVIQMLSLWYDSESFGSSQYEIYSRMIHHQILTAIKAKELPECEGRSTLDFPIGCDSDRCPCKRYGELLWKVATLAFYTLFSENREISLIFDHEVTTFHGLSATEVDECLKIGILTQHKLIVDKLRDEKKSVSFLHKTNQEFFASVFISSHGQRSDVQHINSVIGDLDRALELDKVLLFCSELNMELARQLSHLISMKADANVRVQEYRQSCCLKARNADVIKKIQNIIVPATQQNTKLFLSDIYLESYRSSFISCIDMTGVKSIHIPSVDATTWKALQELCSLQMFVLRGCQKSADSIRKMILRNSDTLKTLVLSGHTSSLGFPVNLSSLGDKLSDILNGNRLSSLGLVGVQLSHTQCEVLNSHLKKTDNLRQMSLERLSCAQHGRWSGCLGALDCTRHRNLNRIVLRSPSLTTVNFSAEKLQRCEISFNGNTLSEISALKCLRTAKNLQRFNCCDLEDSTSVKELVSILPQLHNLQRHELYGVQFGSLRDIRLSTGMMHLDSVYMFDCTIKCEGLNSLISSLPAHKVEVGLVGTLSGMLIKGRENILQEIRDSQNTEMIEDSGVKYENGEWRVWNFVFYNNI